MKCIIDYWGLQIPRTQKRLGHFLTTDYKSVETPNGIDAKSSARRPEKSSARRPEKSSARRPEKSSARRPGGFAIRRKKRFDLLKPGDL